MHVYLFPEPRFFCSPGGLFLYSKPNQIQSKRSTGLAAAVGSADVQDLVFWALFFSFFGGLRIDSLRAGMGDGWGGIGVFFLGELRTGGVAYLAN